MAVHVALIVNSAVTCLALAGIGRLLVIIGQLCGQMRDAERRDEDLQRRIAAVERVCMRFGK